MAKEKLIRVLGLEQSDIEDLKTTLGTLTSPNEREKQIQQVSYGLSVLALKEIGKDKEFEE